MCGIAAIFKRSATECTLHDLQQMTDLVAHRGPDDSGTVIFDPAGRTLPNADAGRVDWTVGLGHRRLSILDLSAAGHQPMVYRNRFWLTFNGEIYNFIELRQALMAQGHRFASTSDTEVILAAYAEWGTASFQRLRGMWGFVLVDFPLRRAFLCRDRMGIKPLYLWRQPDRFAVVSEIKQLLKVPGFRPRVNRQCGARYLLSGYEDQHQTLFHEVEPLAPGCWVELSLDSLQLGSAQTFWQPERIQPTVRDPAEAARMFADKLTEAVRIHLRSDVPVGCALSGGLDSSAVAALVDRLNDGTGSQLHTFSATFPGFIRDERYFIEAALGQLRAKPFFVTPTAGTFIEDADRFLWIHDEPPGGFSQYSGYCIARLTREAKVPVTLNGQGGDEVLGGYWQLYFAYLLGLLRGGHWLKLMGHFGGALLKGGNPDLIRQVPFIWRRYRARTRALVPLRVLGIEPEELLSSSKIQHYMALSPQAQRVSQIRDLFLPQLLKWDDRNFMAFAVEGRYPFLDHELIELCLSFDPAVLNYRGWTKRPLRQGLGHLLPEVIARRRSKFSFETPQDQWLGGTLRPIFERWLEADRPLWNHVQRDGIRDLAEQTWDSAGRRRELGQMLLRAHWFDRWLELFHLDV